MKTSQKMNKLFIAVISNMLLFAAIPINLKGLENVHVHAAEKSCPK